MNAPFQISRRGFALSLALAAAAPMAYLVSCTPASSPFTRVLPSWNDGAARRAIIEFVRAVTTQGAEFVAPEQRIAVFDNDGTLWTEQPLYVEALFSLDRAGEMLAHDPVLVKSPAFAKLKNGGPSALSEADLAALVEATHSGMSPESFTTIVRHWLATAEHPRFRRPFTKCVYQPMLEAMDYLRAHGFKTFIVSGGGIDFMRAFAAETYGVPADQVIGSSGLVRFDESSNDVVKMPGLGSIDDKSGKPANIALHIGARPLVAFGNSDGDKQMLEYTTGGTGRRLGVIVHHDDAAREYAYDRGSKVGALSVALDEAPARGWVLVSMKNDWKDIFPPTRLASR